jgi:signal transduction histidine kinase
VIATEESLTQLEALASEQAALRRVATLVTGNPDPTEVFVTVCAEVGKLLGVKSTNLTRFERDGTQTVVAGWSVHGAPVFPVSGGVPIDGGAAVAKAARSGRPERVDDYAHVEGDLPVRVRAAGIASSVAAPITVASRLWGAIVASSGEPRSLPRDTEERVARFAELVSNALANADARQQLAASRVRLLHAADAERRRLERNLHDGAQQRLVGLAITLREVDEEIGRDVTAAREVLALARRELAHALDELRELARGIHPAVLSDRGLAPALEALAARVPLPVELRGVPGERLPEAVEAAAYFVITEALTNVVKHARATGVTVEVTRSAGQAVICVSDDGVGGATIREGSGLRGLCDRVEALGGTLAIRSEAGSGTAVMAELPLA